MIRNSVIREKLELIQRRLDLMDRTLVVNNPDSPRAAEVFDGLRKSVLRSTSVTKIHEAALAHLDMIATTTSDMEMIRTKINELMVAADVTATEDFEALPQAFEAMGSGEMRRMVRPAYLGAGGAEVIVRGVVEFFDDSSPSSKSEAIPVHDERTISEVADREVTDLEPETGNPQKDGS